MAGIAARIALIHATPVAIQPIVATFAERWPDAVIHNILDDSLPGDLERAGGLDAKMDERFVRLARYAADCGADGILFTCSAFGRSIEAAAAAVQPMPVLKPNEAMFDEALKLGQRIGMIATFQPSIPSMEEEFQAIATAAGSSAQLTSVCVPDAMAALKSGDAETHNRLIAAAAAALADADAILLAQFSTAKAREAVRKATGLPVLTSPASAVTALQKLI